MGSRRILVQICLFGLACSQTTVVTTDLTTGDTTVTAPTGATTDATGATTDATGATTDATRTTGTPGFTSFTGPTGTETTTFPTDTTAWTTDATTTAAATVNILKQKVKIGKTNFKCDFFLVFNGDIVDIDSSTMSCKGKGKGSGKVKLTTPEGYTFSAVVKMPKTIVSLVGGDIFGEVYKNITTESKREHSTHCGGYDGEIEGKKTRGYTTTEVKLWPNAEVDWAFVSTGDAYKKYSFYSDKNIGYTEAEVKMIMKSMKRIEENTCIRFKRRNPEKGKPWLLVMREAQVDKNGQGTCYRSYIESKLKNKEIGSIGKIFDTWWDGSCFAGAYVDGLGTNSPVRMVVSTATLEDNENNIGLLAHELMHVLGVGHTQKRPDRDTYITINWNNVQESGKAQLKKCEGNTCQTHNTDYDCASLMHYSDDSFSNGNGKTMTAKDANKCTLSNYNTKLTNSDVTLLKKMYCDKTSKNLVISPNYPKDYPASQDKVYAVKVDDGYVIEIVFTDFTLETKTDCSTDWVQVVDDDGTELLKKSCGTTKPGKVTSKSKSLKVKFHSDATNNYKGFRAEWKAVKKVAAVDGVWSNWGTWSPCSNNKDGKTACSTQRYRYCNNPAAANGGKACEGDKDEKKACTSSDMSEASKHPNCVMTGGWTAWGKGTKCSSACKTTRSRACTNPAPFNSKVCDGAKSETTACTGGDCSSTDSGAIKSPNYPSNYPTSKTIEYTITAPSGSRVELTFVDFVLEDESQCGYDYVQVLDTDGSQLIKKCGSTKPSAVVSTGNVMKVKFHSDSEVVAKGFHATWKKVTATESGIIKSPNYPKSYSSNADKTYSLSVADGSKIELSFTDFNVEAEASCSYDYVEVFDTNGKSLKKFCGSTKPATITSSGKSMKVKFHSDYYVETKGFSATWKKV